ncbi:pyridoxal phosphate-dependent aminotransferase [Leadbettera azotonutricia]|uniref:Aminotransferase n=1 Tax=Leadbettera azotonutricia (strain ATCC BAA-888 / DSM 13862 / ZAS-9) TaxID=545695 RepID=F5YCA4_LEAAZ|nr:pyridoxal phosphate-dependent aminotransferase [Leadbettera azotonutricia]AEF82929.1 aspartate aminotransferase [Leadbettera azotonutricia ZAS-9]
MPIANAIKEALGSQSMIRKMFEEGTQLKKQHGADKVFDFSLGNPDIEPPPAFHRVFLKMAKEDKKGSHGYMPNAGYPEVREALAQKASKEHGVAIDGSHIVMAVGAAGGLNVVFKSILNPGDEVIVPRPYFMEYRSYVGNHGGKLVEADTLPDFNLDLNAIKAKLSAKTAAVLINSPHNPTGRIYSAQTLSELAKILEEHGNASGRMPYLISDEPYREIAYDGIEVPPVLAVYSESLVVSSYSKSLSLPGERIGFVAVGPKVSDKLNVVGALIFATRILGFVNAPALMQRIVAELIFAKVDIDIYARRRAAFTKILDDVGIPYARPEGAFYLFCKVPGKGGKPLTQGEAGDDKAFVDHLKQYLILGVPGTGFGKPGWLRFAYCVDEKIIKASGEAFKKAMENW